MLRRKVFGHMVRVDIGGSFVPKGAHESDLRGKLTYFFGCRGKKRLQFLFSAF